MMKYYNIKSITILVLCTGNSCRSQMMEGYLKDFFKDNEEIKVYSAGIESHGLNLNAVRVMAEDNIDISHHQSTSIANYEGKNFDYIITVCDHANAHCPTFPGTSIRIHEEFIDPAKAIGSEAEINLCFRETRDNIKKFAHTFSKKLLAEFD